jgi:hypothetical protein
MADGWAGTLQLILPAASAKYSPVAAMVLSTLAYCACIRTVLHELDPKPAPKPGQSQPTATTSTPAP